MAASNADFMLFVPAQGEPRPSASGPVGCQPDTGILGDRNLWVDCQRSRLPRFLDNLIFTFPVVAEQERVQNFYHLGAYLLLCGEPFSLMQKTLGSAIECRRIEMRHMNGRPSAEPYWAVCMKTWVDCIDPELSFTEKGYNRVSEASFAETRASILLDDQCRTDFANAEDGSYVFYTRWQITKNIVLREGSLNSGGCIVRPRFWPGHWLISSLFARQLLTHCRGGSPGYYFWTLDLDRISQHYGELCVALR